MTIPLQITFRGLSSMPSVVQLISERSARLERFCDRISRCHVVVGMPHRHQRNGRRYSVHIDIGTPLGNIVVTREPPAHASAEQLGVAIREAFDAATRQLEDESGRRRSA